MADAKTTDETSAMVLDAAAEALRSFVHLTGRHFDERPGWEYPSDAYDCLGELTLLAGRLPQVFELLTAAVRAQHELHLIDVATGFAHEKDPAGAAEAMSVALDGARVAAQQMCSGLMEAQRVLSGVSYGGPDSALGDRP